MEDKTKKEVSIKQKQEIVGEEKKTVQESRAVKTELSNIDVDNSNKHKFKRRCYRFGYH